MKFEEAKKLLKKEFMVIGIHKTTEPFEFDESGWFGYEKPAVLEAFRVLAKEGYYISISGHDYNEREKRLKKEYDKNHIKGDFSGNKSIEHCGEPIPGPGEEQPEEKKGIIYPTTFPKADFYYKHVLNEGNPALKEAASQFNDALLDEQAKKIEKLAKENERLKDQIAVLDAYKKHNDKIDRSQIQRLGKEIARLNKIIRKKNLKIEELRKESSRHLRGEVKFFGETLDLSETYEYGDKKLKYALHFNEDGSITFECSDPDKKPRIPISEESREDFIKKTIDNYNRIAANLGCVGSKGGNGIIDQMVGADVAAKGADLTGVIIIKSEK